MRRVATANSKSCRPICYGHDFRSEPLGFSTLFILRNSKYCTTRIRKVQALDLNLFSGEGKETPTLLGPLERANFNELELFLRDPTKYVFALPSLEDRNRSSFQNVVF
jgi:hypothetical protein